MNALYVPYVLFWTSKFLMKDLMTTGVAKFLRLHSFVSFLFSRWLASKFAKKMILSEKQSMNNRKAIYLSRYDILTEGASST